MPSPWALLAVIALLRGCSYLPTQWALGALPPIAVVVLQVLGAGLFLLVALVAGRALRPMLALARRAPGPVALLALSQTVVPLTLIALAVGSVQTGAAAILVAPSPILAAMLARATGDRTPLGTAQLAGMGLALAGVVLVGAGAHVGSAAGAGAFLAAGACYAVAAVTMRRHFADTPVLVTAGLTTLPALPVALVALALLPLGGVPATAIGGTLLLGTLTLGVAVVLLVTLVRRVGAARGLLVIYLTPVVALVAAVVAAGEPLTVAAVLGLGTVVAGVALAARPVRPAPAPARPRPGYAPVAATLRPEAVRALGTAQRVRVAAGD
ncbi:DMT family transporter [Paraconexibacter algicola]|uniref:EamA domain-containing protein n=1 Tax=Paraconexibacter algicola TaxID=2133960 RepID=A0A2T4UJT1_9ACTN|nr:DMT family transporter [Paraconexibacter algicola]PTL59448.1 hypothetical protein C7Y72_07175 [Paraconexibacter algicola]